MVTATKTDNVETAVNDVLLKDARHFFEAGAERTAALSRVMREHDVFLTREVLLYLALPGLGTLFDAATKALGMKASADYGKTNGGSAIGTRSTGFGGVLSGGFVSAAIKFAKTKSIFGTLLIDTDLASMRAAKLRSSHQVGGWSLTDAAIEASLPLYEAYGKFTDMPPEAQAEVATLISDADNARTETPAEEI